MRQYGGGYFGSAQQLFGREWCARGPVFTLDAMTTALLAQMLAQELPRSRIDQPYMCATPLHLNAAADPAGRGAVIRRFDFHAAIQMDRAFAVLVVAKGLKRQGQQRWAFFGEHGCDLPFGGAVNAGVSPALLPLIQVGLRFFQAFEALPF